MTSNYSFLQTKSVPYCSKGAITEITGFLRSRVCLDIETAYLDKTFSRSSKGNRHLNGCFSLSTGFAHLSRCEEGTCIKRYLFRLAVGNATSTGEDL